MTELARLLRPSYVKNEPGHIQVNGQLNRVIMAVGYPRTIREGWLDSIVSSEGNFDMSIHIKPSHIEAVLSQLNQELVKQESDLMAAQMKGIVNPSLRIQQQDTMSVLEKLQKGEEKLFNISLYIGARAYTGEKLELLARKIMSELNSMMIIPKSPFLRMADGMKSVYPIQEDRLREDRNITSDALAACFPFTTAYLDLDADGILFGLNRSNNIPIVLDPFRFANYNGLILGTSGGGKSVTAKLFILRNLLRGVKTTIIDPQGEYVDLTQRNGGQVIEICRESETMINPFDLMGADFGEKTIALTDLFKIMCGELTETHKNILDSAVHKIYRQKGITHDNPETWAKEPPVMEDLYNEITHEKKGATRHEREAYETLENRLRIYVHGSFSFLNRQTRLDLNNELICFNITGMPQQIKPAMMYLIMDFVHKKMQKDRERKMLVIDEAWSLLRFAEHSKSIYELMKTARKFGMGILIITQEAEDLLGSQAGKTILANTAWKFLSRQEPAAISEIAEKFSLNSIEQNYLLTALPGDGLLIAMNDHISLKVVPSPQEYELVTTNPDEVRKKEQKQKELAGKVPETSLCVGGKPYYRAEELRPGQIDNLKRKGFVEAKLLGLEPTPRLFLVKKPEPGGSEEHDFMVHVMADEIRKYTPNVTTFSSFGPDIVFGVESQDKRILYYAMEVETRFRAEKPEDLELKVSRNNSSESPKYSGWWFVVYDRQAKNDYQKLHETLVKDEVRGKILEIFGKL